MGIQVSGYTRHTNNRLVTVHGYQTNERDPLMPTMPINNTTMVRQFADRATARGMAPPGLFASTTPDIVRGMGGLNAYVFHPPVHEPIVRYRRTILPKRGLYPIGRFNGNASK